MSSAGHLPELDQLRSQVADLARELAERDRVLHEQSRHLHVAQALAHLGSWDWDIRSARVDWSDEMYRIFGYEPNSLTITFDIFLSVILPNDHDRVLASINDTLAGKAPYDLECRIVRSNGEVRTIHCRAEVLRDNNGLPLRMLGTALDITERKRKESALQQREAHYRTLIEHSSDAITILELDGTIRFESPSFERLLGYAQHELNGRIAFEFLHPEDLPVVLKKFQLLIQKPDSPQIAEFRFRHKDGSWVKFEGIGRAISDPEGRRCVIVNSRDITERKRAEVMLRSSQEKLRQALQASGTGLWDWNTKTNEVVLSREWKAQLGYGETELSNSFENWQALLHPDDHDGALAYTRTYLARPEGDYRQEFRLRHKDGSYRWIEARASLITEADGQQIRLLGSHTDITDRKRMEEVVRESEERYRALIELLPSGVFVFCEGRTVYVNQMGAMIMGAKDPREILDRPTFDFIHPDYHDDVRENVKRLLSGGVSVHRAERIYLKLDGTMVPVQVEAAKITWNGKLAILGIFSDITERKRAEEALRESEERFAKAFRTTPHPVGITEMITGRCIEVNDACLQLFGFSREEVIGNTTLMLGIWPTPAERTRLIERLKTGGPVRDLEISVRTKHGEIRHILVSSDMVELNGTVCLITVGNDVTERKRAVEALQRSERDLRTVLDALPIGVWFTDRNGKPILSNPASQRIWTSAKQVEWVAGERMWKESTEKTTGPHRWALSRVLTHGEPSLNETFELDCGAEGKRTVLNSAVPVRDDDGTVVGAVVLNEDISDRVQAEEALRQNHTLLSAIMNASIDLIYIKDLNGHYVHMNQAGAQALGIPVHDIIGCDDVVLWGSELAASCRLSDQLVIESGQTITIEEDGRTQGRPVHYLTTKAPYRDPEGQIIGVIGVSRDITERKQAEEALRISEERFAKAFQASLHPVVISDLDSGRLVDANDAAYQLFGYRKDEVAGKTLVEIGLWNSLEERTRYLELLKQQGSVRNMEVRLRSRSGEVRQCLISSELIVLNGQQCIVAVGDDITERKRAERTLQRSEERFRSIFQHAGIGIAFSDAECRYIQCNPAYCSIVGYTEEELRQTTFQHVIYTEDYARNLTLVEELANNAIPSFEVENRYLHKDGHIVPVHKFVTALRGDDGKVTHFIALVTDISERKRAEVELRKSHSFLRQVIDTNPDFIFAKDRDGRFTLVNEAVAECYGTTVDELIGKSDADFNVNLEEVEFFRQKDLEVMESLQERFIPEEQITDSRGQTRWLQTVKRPILDDQGRAIMVLGAATDITERKRMEEILLQRERDLSVALQERERISQDLHDGILQALYAVGLGLEGCKPLITQQQGKGGKKLLMVLNQGIGQLNHVMAEVRNFIAGLESHVMQGGDFSTALRSMIQTMSSSSSANCRVRIDETAARHISTEQALHIINIVREGLSNALRHSHAAHIAVSFVQLRRSVRLSITDDGVGFVQDSTHGLGHGLDNMAARAQKVGGLLTIRSEPRNGTRILLDLPKDMTYDTN